MPTGNATPSQWNRCALLARPHRRHPGRQRFGADIAVRGTLAPQTPPGNPRGPTQWPADRRAPTPSATTPPPLTAGSSRGPRSGSRSDAPTGRPRPSTTDRRRPSADAPRPIAPPDRREGAAAGEAADTAGTDSRTPGLHQNGLLAIGADGTRHARALDFAAVDPADRGEEQGVIDPSADGNPGATGLRLGAHGRGNGRRVRHQDGGVVLVRRPVDVQP